MNSIALTDVFHHLVNALSHSIEPVSVQLTMNATKGTNFLSPHVLTVTETTRAITRILFRLWPELTNATHGRIDLRSAVRVAPTRASAKARPKAPTWPSHADANAHTSLDLQSVNGQQCERSSTVGLFTGLVQRVKASALFRPSVGSTRA